MFEADDIRDWQGRDVVDVDGGKIGVLEGLYYDTASQQPSFASVQIGIIGRRRLTFVPLAGARVSPGHVRVMVDKKTAKDALTIDTDGALTAAQEPQLFEHYGLAYQPGASGERRLGRR
ncbi:MAG TPA: PRC-barrel domain-containing protein [Mycobacteriales bacterium]